VAHESLPISSPPSSKRRFPGTQRNATGALSAGLRRIGSGTADESDEQYGAATADLTDNRALGWANWLAALDLHPHGFDPGQDLLPQVGRDLLMAAVPVHQALDGLFQAELAQAWAAFIQVDSDLGV